MPKVKLKKIASTPLPTTYGDFRLYLFNEAGANKDHLVLVCGRVKNSPKPVLVRIHSACLTGDVFHSLRCDCGKQLQASMKIIQKKGRGLLIYLDQEGRDIGLANKIKAYVLQDGGLDTVEANQELGFAPDERTFTVAAEILKSFGVKNIILLTNHPQKIFDLEKRGIKVKRQPFWLGKGRHNRAYLETKRKKMQHLF